jgi:hypothetical protein
MMMVCDLRQVHKKVSSLPELYTLAGIHNQAFIAGIKNHPPAADTTRSNAACW